MIWRNWRADNAWWLEPLAIFVLLGVFGALLVVGIVLFFIPSLLLRSRS